MYPFVAISLFFFPYSQPYCKFKDGEQAIKIWPEIPPC